MFTKKTATAFTPRSAETVTKYYPYPTPKNTLYPKPCNLYPQKNTPYPKPYTPKITLYPKKKSHLHIQPLPRLNMPEVRDKILHEPDDSLFVENRTSEKLIQMIKHVADV